MLAWINISAYQFGHAVNLMRSENSEVNSEKLAVWLCSIIDRIFMLVNWLFTINFEITP